MTDNDNRKTVKNELFKASVTGATYEEFSQNAVLFPVQDVPTQITAPILVPSSDTTGTTSPVSTGVLQENFIATHEIPLNENQDNLNQSQLSSIFSSFSNILTFGETNPSVPSGYVNVNQPQTDYSSPIPQNIQPTTIPLFPPINTTTQSAVPTLGAPPIPNPIGLTSAPPQGPSSNVYRRLETKKVVYARVPGLSSGSFNIPPNPESQANPLPFLNNPTPPPNLINPQSQNTNFFHPPSVPKPTITPSQSSSILEEASTDVLTTSYPTLLNPSSFTSPMIQPNSVNPQFSGSVMSSIPDNGISQPPILPNDRVNEAQPMIPTVVTNPLTYRPVYHHWFFKQVIERKTLWEPFSMVDSLALEHAFTSADTLPETVVPTDGGRYDVNILRRERTSVYWKAEPVQVRRCSWFHKGSANARFIPYDENIATMLENEYKTSFESGEWHKKVELPCGDSVVFHGPDVLVLFPPAMAPDAWGNTPQSQAKPSVIKRGMDEFDIDEGEPANVDHVLFMVHGIGSVCDLKFRTVEEVVDEFRHISLQLIRSHYRSACDNGSVGRIEVLPISWHSQLHSDETGIDQNLKNITLESIPRLRDFTNYTLLDILFYTSPIYCQTIVSTVGSELNRIYDLFKQRNPNFKGGVSLAGHSLGSLIVFDLLSHQNPEPPKEQTFVDEDDEDVVPPLKKPHPNERTLSRRISYMMSEAGTGQPQLQYCHLNFEPSAFFALGSPIGMFVTVRGLHKLGVEFTLPTCPLFFNIFHPYDPVAYRIESLINPDFAKLKPVLIPHHKGRKRMHLELRDTMARVGADLKQKLVDSMKSTWNSVFQIALFGRSETNNPPNLEAEVDKVLEEKFAEEQAKQYSHSKQNIEEQSTDLCLGRLNSGRRIDYVLQEAPFEFINEYIFALTSHMCYWESEDTILLILKEIYNSVGVSSDSQVPQPTMTIEKPTASIKPLYVKQLPLQPAAIGMDPTAPIIPKTNIGPPPIQGFVRKP